MNHFLFESDNINRDAYIWNTIASVANSFQTMLLLLVITRLGNLSHGSYFAIAYAVGNLLMSFGKYGMRSFQVTDAGEVYPFGIYLLSRYFTGGVFLLILIGYLLYGRLFLAYSGYKAGCIVLICLVKLIDVMEDVLHGRLQQKGRLDIAAKVQGIRMLSFIALFAVSYRISRNLLLTEGICFLVSLLLALVLNGFVLRKGVVEFSYALKHGEDSGIKSGVQKLLTACFASAASTFLIMYLGNAPKYTIDARVPDEVQTCFNIVFMPVFVISLLSSFIFQPLLKEVGETWARGDRGAFGRIRRRQILWIACITAVCIVAAYFLGIPVLEWIYKVDLSGYLPMLCILLLAGGMLAILNFYIILLVTMRRQLVLIAGFGIAALLMFMTGGPVLSAFGLWGLSVLYCMILGILCMVFSVYYTGFLYLHRV